MKRIRFIDYPGYGEVAKPALWSPLRTTIKLLRPSWEIIPFTAYEGGIFINMEFAMIYRYNTGRHTPWRKAVLEARWIIHELGDRGGGQVGRWAIGHACGAAHTESRKPTLPIRTSQPAQARARTPLPSHPLRAHEARAIGDPGAPGPARRHGEEDLLQDVVGDVGGGHSPKIPVVYQEEDRQAARSRACQAAASDEVGGHARAQGEHHRLASSLVLTSSSKEHVFLAGRRAQLRRSGRADVCPRLRGRAS
ncbi:hypothetical protein E2562_017731 [Oryza meyeriana var. granulata]|uniref:Uncharacterized protein n=1 Tax=Oryza meyeriana var. granulata TaxID=110450 RepID=A0A6G1BXA9_9ORYZ|nr:hypothetical protein E2562_017731 [Oryza meyeriana var. granulata]